MLRILNYINNLYSSLKKPSQKILNKEDVAPPPAIISIEDIDSIFCENKDKELSFQLWNQYGKELFKKVASVSSDCFFSTRQIVHEGIENISSHGEKQALYSKFSSDMSSFVDILCQPRSFLIVARWSPESSPSAEEGIDINFPPIDISHTQDIDSKFCENNSEELSLNLWKQYGKDLFRKVATLDIGCYLHTTTNVRMAIENLSCEKEQSLSFVRTPNKHLAFGVYENTFFSSKEMSIPCDKEKQKLFNEFEEDISLFGFSGGSISELVMCPSDGHIIINKGEETTSKSVGECGNYYEYSAY